MALDFGTAKAGLMLLDLRRGVMDTLTSWGVECSQAEAEELVRQGALGKVLIRHEYQKRKGSEKGGAIILELKARFGVSESLVVKAIRGER